MRRLKFLFRPGWLVLAAVIAVFAFMCFTVLAPWQLGKNTTTEHKNQQITDTSAADATPFDSLLAKSPPTPDDEWRRVTASGTYKQNSDLLVRLRSINDQPAYEVLTPLALDSGQTVLINRGYERPIQGTQPPPLQPPPTGPITVQARIHMSEGTVPGKEPLDQNGLRQVYFIDSAQIGQFIGTDLVNGYLQLEADQPGGLGTIPLPQIDAGPYLSYGLQWLAFGIMAPLGLAYFIRAEWLERRKSKIPENAPEPDADSPPKPVLTPTPAEEPALRRGPLSRKKSSDSAPQTAQQAKLADRYGKNS